MLSRLSMQADGNGDIRIVLHSELRLPPVVIVRDVSIDVELCGALKGTKYKVIAFCLYVNGYIVALIYPLPFLA